MIDKPDIIQTAQVLGCLPEKQSGGRYVGGNCPAKHGSENGRCFNIYPENQSFYCYNCNAGGDAFELIKLFHNCDFKDAVDYARENGLITGNGHNDVRYIEQRKAYRILTDAAKIFHANLKDDSHLKTHYGLTEAPIKQYLIGLRLLIKMLLERL